MVAIRTPEGCQALLDAMKPPIQRWIEYGCPIEPLDDGNAPQKDPFFDDVNTWIIPCLKKIERAPHDRQLHGFILCLMGSICTLLEMKLYVEALADIDAAIAQLAEYQDDAVRMTPLGGRVMSKNEVVAVVERLDEDLLLAELTSETLDGHETPRA